jgi:hypothetical protein
MGAARALPPVISVDRLPFVLKLALIVFVLFFLARLIGRLIPRVEITFVGGSDDSKVFEVMREHFPGRYEQFKHGLLSEGEERRLYLDCLEILGARNEIEKL